MGAGDLYLIKLVRDRADELMVPGMTIEMRTLERVEFAERLRRKLIEEAAEYMANPCVAELADVVECVIGLARLDCGASLADVLDAAADKRRKRGGFVEGVGMYAVPPDGT